MEEKIELNREEAEQYIYRSYLRAEGFQNFSAPDSEKRKPELTKKWIEELCRKSHARSTVITGSKGKGSTAIMIASVMENYYCTGLMTSPHIKKFNERIRVNRKMIPDDEFIRIIEKCRPELDKTDANCADNVCISPIGIQTIAALIYFNENNTEFNIFECGKGAEYDDVNNVIHESSVINSIFLEHTRELGASLQEIAVNKSYVIKEGQKFSYCGHQKAKALEIIRRRALDMKVDLKEYGRDFCAENISYKSNGMLFDIVTSRRKYNNISIPLLGEHQAQNCALAISLCEDETGKEIDEEIIRRSLCSIVWPGRMQILSAANPFIMLDACINSESCQDVRDVLHKMSIDKITLIIGIPDDKDYVGVAGKMCDIAEKIILTGSHSPHYRFSDKRQKMLTAGNIITSYTDYVDEAIMLAVSIGNPVVILGTTSVVSETEDYFTLHS